MDKSSNSILATDFSKVNQDMKQWELEKNKKMNIYRAFSDYIECLETSLQLETDLYKQSVIKKQIKKLKKQQQKFSVPSILEGCKFSPSDNSDKMAKSLKKSSFSLVKKLGKN